MKAEGMKIVIFGVGLIGGSFSLALKKKGIVRESIGFGRSEKTLIEAQRLGIVDRIGTDEDLKDADIILIATPVGQMGEILK
jgi:prephenate dehydrogenase